MQHMLKYTACVLKAPDLYTGPAAPPAGHAETYGTHKPNTIASLTVASNVLSSIVARWPST